MIRCLLKPKKKNDSPQRIKTGSRSWHARKPAPSSETPILACRPEIQKEKK
jgi:hypothetical protein